MSERLDQRYRELRGLEVRAIRWVATRRDIAAIVLVGSFARRTARFDSDVDLMLLVADPHQLNTDLGWLAALTPDAERVRTGRWGAVTEHRVVTPTGLEVEFGVTAPSWADLPLDPGTANVLRNGARPIHDPHHLAATAIAIARGR